MKMERRPSEKDWLDLQGGKPRVTINEPLTIVTHDYPAGGGMIVKSHIAIEEMGSVNILVNGKIVEVPTALIRQFHGEPCEKVSLTTGGHGYERDRG